MKAGILVIFSGASGAGKDSVMEKFLKSPLIQNLNLKKIVTLTDRPPRPGEIDGREYHFVSHDVLSDMSKKGELVEPITTTGTSGKATPKTEIERLLVGENLVWRIDPSRAAEVATGRFFKNLFLEKAEMLQNHTLVLSITAPKDQVENRRKLRDLDKYNPGEYETRDNQEKPYLATLREKSVNIDNLDGKLDDAVNLAVKYALDLYGKVQKEKD